MKKIYIFVIIIVVMLILLYLGIGSINKDKIYVVYEKSYFHNYKILNNVVSFDCEIFINNKYDSQKVVEIYANDYKNVRNGLLSQPLLKGVDTETLDNRFVLNKGENHIKISFQGQHATSNQKADKLLPKEIEIKIIN